MNLKLFRSVRFNIGLFAVLAAASALGTFLPQRHEVPAKVEEFLAAHAAVGPWMDRLGMFNLFHSWWYVALLGLMAFDVVACKLRSLPREVHGEEKIDDRLVSVSPVKDSFELPLPPDEAAARIRGALGARRFKFRERRVDGEIHLWAAKHRLQRWGDFVLHVSVVVILVGAFIGSLKGFEEFLPVPEGMRKPLENRPWVVAVDKFIVDYYEDTGAARTYSSDLRVFDGETQVAGKKIVVNDPLDIGGVRFYQASWGMTGMMRSVTIEIPRKDKEGLLVHIPRGEKTPLEGTSLSVGFDFLLPDFTVGSDGRPDTASLEPKNPAVQITFYEKERPVASLFLLQREPHIAFKVMPDGTVAPAAHPPFRLRHFDPVLFSGLQVTYDPGVKVVGYGCVALLVGLALHFYFHQRRLRLLLAPKGGGTLVTAGGWSSRGAADFDPEFRALVAALRN